MPFVAGSDRGEAARAVGAEILADLHSSASSAAHDPKAWLAQRFPDAGSTREGVRQLLETVLAGLRPTAAPEVASGEEAALDLDQRLARCEAVLELLAALDGNVNADLVFEKLVGDLARIAR